MWGSSGAARGSRFTRAHHEQMSSLGRETEKGSPIFVQIRSNILNRQGFVWAKPLTMSEDAVLESWLGRTPRWLRVVVDLSVGQCGRDSPDRVPLVAAVVADWRNGVSAGIIAARFHNAQVDAIVGVAEAVGEPAVALTGGCFQNRLLSERAATRLREAGFEVLLHQQVPANDGCISLGQVMIAAEQLD